MNSASRYQSRLGMTLIELLVVISILLVVTALVVPQIRIISKDRSIREAARVVGGGIVEASQKARADGFAGIVFFRNQRAVRLTPTSPGLEIYYSSNSFAQLKFPLPFTGNTDSDLALISSMGGTVTIPKPFDANVLIEDGSYIQFGSTPTKFLIRTVLDSSPNLVLTIDLPDYVPRPASGQRFRVWRRPKIDENTITNLPRGYVLNLNYSGHLAPLGGDPYSWTTLSIPTNALPTPEEENANRQVIVLFDERGGIDRIYPNGNLNNGSMGYVPNTTMFLCVCEDSIGNSFLGDPMPQSFVTDGLDLLDDPTVMWVTASYDSGSVNVASSSPPSTPASSTFAVQQLRILESLRISGKRQIAEQ